MLINLIYISIILVSIVAVIALFIKFRIIKDVDNCYSEVKSNHPLHINNICGDKRSDLQLIKGIGKILEKRLNSNGIYCVKQIAKWSEDDIKRVNKIISFPGRVEREHWIEQAKALINKKS